MVDPALNPWDILATQVLIEEAGGVAILRPSMVTRAKLMPYLETVRSFNNLGVTSLFEIWGFVADPFSQRSIPMGCIGNLSPNFSKLSNPSPKESPEIY